jgi:YbbR domain-containing protein
MQIKINPESNYTEKIGLTLGAFGLSLLLWIFVVSENEYTMVLDFPIEARNLSVQKAHKEEVPSYATVKIKGVGRDLFKTYVLLPFTDSKLVLDLEGISKDYEFILNEYFDQNPQKVVIPLNYKIEYVEVVYPYKIKISLDEFISKKVPVFSNIIVTPKAGFTIVGNETIQPDQITIAGPEEELALINHLETTNDTILDVDGLLLKKVPIASLGKLIKYSENFVNINLNIQQISERIIANVPVKIIDVPSGIRVFSSPQTVSLTVVGGVRRIASLKPNEIKIYINFKKWNISKQFYEPNVVIPSDLLEWRDLSPRNLELAVAREIK